jgi:hypothetical protein
MLRFALRFHIVEIRFVMDYNTVVRGCLGYALGIGLRGGLFCLLLHGLFFSALCSTFLHVTLLHYLTQP